MITLYTNVSATPGPSIGKGFQAVACSPGPVVTMVTSFDAAVSVLEVQLNDVAADGIGAGAHVFERHRLDALDDGLQGHGSLGHDVGEGHLTR